MTEAPILRGGRPAAGATFHVEHRRCRHRAKWTPALADAADAVCLRHRGPPPPRRLCLRRWRCRRQRRRRRSDPGLGIIRGLSKGRARVAARHQPTVVDRRGVGFRPPVCTVGCGSTRACWPRCLSLPRRSCSRVPAWTWLPREAVRSLVQGFLIVSAIYTFLRGDVGGIHPPRLACQWEPIGGLRGGHDPGPFRPFARPWRWAVSALCVCPRVRLGDADRICGGQGRHRRNHADRPRLLCRNRPGVLGGRGADHCGKHRRGVSWERGLRQGAAFVRRAFLAPVTALI